MESPVKSAPPREVLERVVSETWQEVFKRDPIGLEENFFELGGTSLLALDLLELLSARTGIDVPVLTLFYNPSIRELVQVIVAENGTESAR